MTFSSNPVSWLVFFTLLAGAPLLSGIVNKLKARLSGRFGASVLQPYFDLVRLGRKETVYSRSSGFITRLAPVVVWNTTAFAMLLLPVGPFPASISFDGDFILLAYLLGLGRFLQILAALDVASSFEGMGASREARFAVFAEPIFFFTFGSLALVTGRFSLQSIVSGIAWDKPLFPIFIVVSSISIFFLMITECSRMPVDDPNTHLELTMIHEVMILDASGFDSDALPARRLAQAAALCLPDFHPAESIWLAQSDSRRGALRWRPGGAGSLPGGHRNSDGAVQTGARPPVPTLRHGHRRT